MLEDKLTHDERLRLECIAQANNTAAMYMHTAVPAGPAKIVEIAAKYESFVKGE